MACTLNTGRKLPCKSAFGGIKTVWFGDFGGITGVTVDSTTKQVTTIAGTQPNWYQFDVKGNSSLETTVTSSRENGTTFYTQTLNLTLTFLEAKTVVSGAAAGDLSGFTLVMEGQEELAPYFLDSGLITADATQIAPN